MSGGLSALSRETSLIATIGCERSGRTSGSSKLNESAGENRLATVEMNAIAPNRMPAPGWHNRGTILPARLRSVPFGNNPCDASPVRDDRTFGEGGI